jgi:putative transposase
LIAKNLVLASILIIIAIPRECITTRVIGNNLHRKEKERNQMTRLNGKQLELAKSISRECKTPADVTELLKSLFAGTLEQMLEAEIEEHLGYEKHSPVGDHSGNSRNGFNKKTLKSEWGEVELAAPRDRNGTFDPQVIKNRQTRTEDLEGRIMAMYGKGMSTREIEEYVRDIYGADVSPGLVSKITDKIMPEVREWQGRPLDDIYPIVFFDGVWFKGRSDGKVVKKCAYSVLGVTVEGKKDILGIWIAESESASFWVSVFNDLKNRGVKDILIACHDNLAGFSRAMETTYPRSENQLCIVHQIRNSLAFVNRKERKTLAAALKKIYTAPNLEDAEYQLELFREEYGKKYPYILKSWDANWAELSTFFKYPEAVRRLIYTTNPVEGFHRMLRKYTKTKTMFPTDDALIKSIYMSIQEINKKWTVSVRDWNEIWGQLMIFFEDRLSGVRFP